MKKKQAISEIVGKMTQQERDKLYKTGIVVWIADILVGIPWLICILVQILPLFTGESIDLPSLTTTLIIFLIGGVLLFGTIVAAVIVCPGFSDSKWFYIHKMKKGKIPNK